MSLQTIPCQLDASLVLARKRITSKTGRDKEMRSTAKCSRCRQTSGRSASEGPQAARVAYWEYFSVKCAATERKEGERHAGEAGQSERRSGDPRGRRLAVASFARDRHPSTLIARARRMPAGRECNCVNTEGKKSTEVVGRQGEELQDRQVRYD